MKTSALFALASAFAPALACVHSVGVVLFQDRPVLQTAYIIDNGALICDSAWGTSLTTPGWNINCISGYSMVLASSGQTVWYYTPHGNYAWNQATNQGSSAASWDVYQYC